MTTPLCMLVAFAAWTVFLVTVLGAVRVTLVLTGRAPANGFPSGVPHGSDAYWRLNRAHLNAVENLPLFATVVLVGAVTNVTAPAFATLSVVVMGGRIVQSLVHVASGSKEAVLVRFAAFAVQLAAQVGMIGILCCGR